MSEYRLFLEIRVFEQVRVLRAAERQLLMDALEQIRHRPADCSDYTESDSVGCLVHIHIAGRFAVKYWEDFADRHLKILDIHPADRVRGGSHPS